MSNKTPWDKITDWLRNNQQNRGLHATLRKSFPDPISFEVVESLRPVLLDVKSHPSPQDEEDCYLVARLWALHPKFGPKTFPQAMLEISSDAIATRFKQLLSSPREDLKMLLGPLISYLGAKEIPIDWADMYRAIRSWDDPGQNAQMRWARAFWSRPAKRETNTQTEQDKQEQS